MENESIENLIDSASSRETVNINIDCEGDGLHSVSKDDSGIACEQSTPEAGEHGHEQVACGSETTNPYPIDPLQDVEMCSDSVEVPTENDSGVPSLSSIISESSSDVSTNKLSLVQESENFTEKSNAGTYSSRVSEDRDDVSAIVNVAEENCVTNNVDAETLSDRDDGSSNFKRKLKSQESGGSANLVAKDEDMNGEASGQHNESLSSLTSSDEEEGGDGSAEQTGTAGAESLSKMSLRYKRQKLRRHRKLRISQSSDTPSSTSSSDSEMDYIADVLAGNSGGGGGGSNDNSNDEDEDGEGGDDILHDSDSSTDSEPGVTGNDILKTAEEILNKSLPRPNWFVLRELRRREYGCTTRQSSSLFNDQVQGSLYMARRLQLVDSMKYHSGCVNSLCFNRIGTLLASGSDDLNIVLWNWQRRRPSLVYNSGHRSNVFQAKFMPYSSDCHIVSCARDGQVRLAELSLTGVCRDTRKLVQHKGAAHKLALEQDTPNVFLSCGEDAVTYMFDLREEKPQRLVTTKEGEKKVPLYSIHSNPTNPQQFCVGGRDHYIRVYDKRKISEEIDGGVLKKLCPDHLVDSTNKANVTCACYNYNGTEIVGSYNDEDIYLFDNTHSDGFNFVHRYSGHRNNETVKGVNFFGPKSEFVVSGSDCGNLYLWEKESEAIITFLPGDEAGVINVLEPHPSFPVLATSGLDHDVKLWLPTNTDPSLDSEKLKKTVVKNLRQRKAELSAEPSVMSGQMLWMMMHHFRNTARRRLREEGQELSTSDNDDDDGSDDSETNAQINQCAQS